MPPASEMKWAWPWHKAADDKEHLKAKHFRGQGLLVLQAVERGQSKAPIPAQDKLGPWTDADNPTVVERTGLKEREVIYQREDLERRGLLERRAESGPFRNHWRTRPDRYKDALPYGSGETYAKQQAARERAAKQRETPKLITFVPGTRETITLEQAVESVRIVSIDAAPFTAGQSVEHGVLTLEIRHTDAPEKPPPKANATANEKRTPTAPPCSSTEAAQAEVVSNQQNALAELLQPFALDYWGVPLDQTILNRLTTILGDTPVDVFKNRLEQRLKQGRIRTGLLAKIALDAVADWTTLKPMREAQQAEERTRAAAAERVLDELGALEELEAEPKEWKPFDPREAERKRLAERAEAFRRQGK
jgi:hypothetical protein